LTRAEMARHRLVRQHLVAPSIETPAEVVRWLGAVQAQDYAGAKWAVGQRMRGGDDAAVERAFDDGSIIRTHILRPTWHFVAPADLRWMLSLTAPRVHVANAFMYRTLELDAKVLRRSRDVLVRALRDGKHLTRTELAKALNRAGVDATDTQRLAYVVMWAELEGVVCSGPRRGKQFTYALVDERVPPAPRRGREEALLELTRMYFRSRGPATVRDFAWWSGLTIAGAKEGVQLAGRELEHALLDDQSYWFVPSDTPVQPPARTTHLLPNYDEYFIGFKDRTAMGDVVSAAKLSGREVALVAHIVVIDGQVVGGWKRAIAKGRVLLELTPIVPLKKADRRAIELAAQRYAAFLGLSLELSIVSSSMERHQQ
jgi:hypothetical protein